MPYNYATAFKKRLCPNCAARILVAAAAKFRLENPDYAEEAVLDSFCVENRTITLTGVGIVVTYEFDDLVDGAC